MIFCDYIDLIELFLLDEVYLDVSVLLYFVGSVMWIV